MVLLLSIHKAVKKMYVVYIMGTNCYVGAELASEFCEKYILF
jgi:hypothetical protein